MAESFQSTVIRLKQQKPIQFSSVPNLDTRSASAKSEQQFGLTELKGLQIQECNRKPGNEVLRVGHQGRSRRKAATTARRMAASGARFSIQISHCAKPCARNISRPETAAIPFLAAIFKSSVLCGR